MKKLLLLLTFITVCLGNIHSQLPNYQSFWSEMAKDRNHQAVVNSPFATVKENLQEKWKTQIAPSWMNGGQPIIVNDYVYAAINSEILRIDPETGGIVARGTMKGSGGYFSMIAYGEGKIFVPMNNGLLQAFNAETLESLWVTEAKKSHQQLCPVVYHDGYVYTGTWKGGASATGTYYCVKAEDEDPEDKEEIKEIIWESGNTGYYWTGGTVVDDVIIFGGDSGVLESRDRRTGELKDEFQVEKGMIRCGTSYDPTTRTIYFTAAEAKKIYGIQINADGTFNHKTILAGETYGEATTTPTLCNGRIYVTAGRMTSSGGVSVHDATTLECIYTIDLPSTSTSFNNGISQSTPLITTAYATPENNYTVYIYICLNNPNGGIVCLKDFQGNEEPLIQYEWIPSSIQYCTHSLVADKKGTIYYKNDAKYLYALKSVPVEVTEVTLDQTSLELYIDDIEELTATVKPELASNRNVSWESSDTDVATVENGQVVAVGVGTATITVTTEDGELTATCDVTVTNRPVNVELVTLDRNEVKLYVQEGTTLTATINPNNADNLNVSWRSSNSDVATVDQSGYITGRSAGVAYITVTTEEGGYTSSCQVLVVDDINPEVKTPNDSTLIVSFPKVRQADRYNLYLYRNEGGEETLEKTYNLDMYGNDIKGKNTLRAGTDLISATILKKSATAGYSIVIDAIQQVGYASYVIATHTSTVSNPVSNESVEPNSASVNYYDNSIHFKGMNGYTCYIINLGGVIQNVIDVREDNYTHHTHIQSGVYIINAVKGSSKLTKKFIVK